MGFKLAQTMGINWTPIRHEPVGNVLGLMADSLLSHLFQPKQWESATTRPPGH